MMSWRRRYERDIVTRYAHDANTALRAPPAVVYERRDGVYVDDTKMPRRKIIAHIRQRANAARAAVADVVHAAIMSPVDVQGQFIAVRHERHVGATLRE